MTTRTRAAAIAAALAIAAGLTACGQATPPVRAAARTPVVSPTTDPSPCGSGGAHSDEDTSGYVTDALGEPVLDTWGGFGGGAAIVCIGVIADDGSIQGAIDAEFGEGKALVVSMFPRSDYTVTTRARTTVVDDGERPPQLCVTADEPLPPQCDGIDLVGWDWGSVGGAYEEHGGVRWGDYFVTGTYSFDTDELTVESATADGPDIGFAWDSPAGVCPDGSARTPEELRAIYDQDATGFLERELGIHSYWWGDDGCGKLAIGVAFDDGRLQHVFGEQPRDGGVLIVPLLRETQ